MYSDERIIINLREFMIEELYDKYREGRLIFYEKNRVLKNRKQKIIKSVLDAIEQGIPFPPVYVSELQSGELLVLEIDDRLRFLMEFLDNGFYYTFSEEYYDLNYKYEKYYNRREICYSTILVYVIDYINPRYKHMQVGSFIGQWMPAQEQAIRNILYKELKDSVFREVLSDMRYFRSMDLLVEYNFLYFIMVYLVAEDRLTKRDYSGCDKFVLLEATIEELKYIDYTYLDFLRYRFEDCYNLVKDLIGNSKINRLSNSCITNQMAFLNIWHLIDAGNNAIIFDNRRIKKMIEDCDMSYEGIKQIIENFKRGVV